MFRQSITILIIVFFSAFLSCQIAEAQQPSEKIFFNSQFGIDSASGIKLGNLPGGDLLVSEDPVFLSSFVSHKYLVVECEQEELVSGIVLFEFFKKSNENPSLQSKIGLLPGLRTYLVFPVSYLDGQQIFLPRFPRQMKGVVFGNRINPENLSKIKIYSGNQGSNGIRIYNLFLTDELPDFDALTGNTVADSLGQWKQKDWKNKITTSKEWNKHKENLQNLAEVKLDFPGEFSTYGGWKKLRFDSTGFFRTHHDGNRWWFVDPEGYAFLSFGMDCVRPFVPAVHTGNENFFEDLPADTGVYRQVYGEVRGMKTVDFFRLNMIRVFGESWYEKWIDVSRNKLLSANFNTVGNWSLEDFSKKSDIPYVLPLNRFPDTKYKLYRDFPDVFSPEYRKNAIEFAAQLEAYKEDPYLIGYFLRNEPQWAFGNNNLAFEMLAERELTWTRSVLALWLQEKYKNIDSLSLSWKLEFESFNDILSLVLIEYPSERCLEDLWEFSKLMVKEYVDVVSEETRKVAPNHLNLGMRYAYISSDLLYTAGEAFDVFSINGYNAPGPPKTSEIYEKSGKPVLIGEYHFGATDRGLPSTGLRGVENQKERGIAYRYYLEQGFARPELIGIHYFQWMDQSIMGRFDGENYNIGFNDILYQSYEELFRQAEKAHLNAYLVAVGEKKPYSKKAKSSQTIAF
jgi:hypothetical protein